MTKDEAIQAMEQGHKVTHRYFSADEWMRLAGRLYEFEDGCLCDPDEFWPDREEGFDDGWSIYTLEQQI